jgi:hypothetical protein
LAKKSRVWDGTAWQELASAQTDLTAYSTTAQMNTAITAGVGLVPILTQTIGTAVSSVTVNNAFSETYDNYKILISGGVTSASPDVRFNMKIGSLTANYYWSGQYIPYSGGASLLQGNVAGNWDYMGGGGQPQGLYGDIDVHDPFLAKKTRVRSYFFDNSGAANMLGYINDTTSVTSFILTPNTGTITGGTIRVYGYKN